MNLQSRSIYALSFLLLAVGCSDGTDPPLEEIPGGTGAGMGVTGGTGGTVNPGTGGALNNTGGAINGTGGVANGTGGGITGTGGVENATGGAEPGTGGAEPGTGGAEPATGGTQGGTGGTPPACNDAEGEVCSSYKVGQHCGLTYEIWTDSASACMTNTKTGFIAKWDQGDGNYLARKGVRPGSTSPVVTYSAQYNPGNNNTYLGVYGWTTDPLIEYYIIESYGSYNPSTGASKLGTVDTDGGTYDIYRTQRVNKPSIQGDTTFWQYWSVRTQKRTSGTITVKAHFDAWAESGLALGDFYEVSMLVEGYQSQGQATVDVTFK